MDQIHLNHWAILACAALNLLIGGLWYSPLLFHRAWLEAAGLDEARAQAGHPAKTLVPAFLLGYAMAYNLAFFLGEADTTWTWGAAAGFLAGFGWATLALAVIALFEKRPIRYILINGGYVTIFFTAMGIILGLWR